jgi:hypothetical protein
MFSMVRTNCFLISSTFDIRHPTSDIVPKNAPAPNAAISAGTRTDIVFIKLYIKVYTVGFVYSVQSLLMNNRILEYPQKSEIYYLLRDTSPFENIP